MGRIKFEKINMKIVAAVAVAIILILTVIFIVINTGKGDKGKDSNTNTNTNPVEGPIISEEAKDRTKDLDKLNSAEKKYIIEQNFLEYLKNLNPEKYQELIEKCVEGQECTISIEDFLDYIEDPENPTNPDDPNNPEDNMLKIEDCNGNISYVYNNGEFKVDMSGVTCKGPNIGGDDSNSNTNTNTNIVDPDGDSNDNNGEVVSTDTKDRTKHVNRLTPDEKKYIIEENILSSYSGNTGIREECSYENVHDGCKVNVNYFTAYSDDPKIGLKISGCSGSVFVSYYSMGYEKVDSKRSDALKVVADDKSKLEKNEIKIGDVALYLNSNNLTSGSYVLKRNVIVYESASPYTQNALKVVKDGKKTLSSEIEISSVKPRLNLNNLRVGDYVSTKNIVAYVPTTKNTKSALKVVSRDEGIAENEKDKKIKIYDVVPYLSNSSVSVGSYVSKGKFIFDTTNLKCN